MIVCDDKTLRMPAIMIPSAGCHSALLPHSVVSICSHWSILLVISLDLCLFVAVTGTSLQPMPLAQIYTMQFTNTLTPFKTHYGILAAPAERHNIDILWLSK